MIDNENTPHVPRAFYAYPLSSNLTGAHSVGNATWTRLLSGTLRNSVERVD